MPVTGVNPDFSIYICNDCGEQMVLSNKTIIFPPCPKCFGNSYKKE
ncbi:MAG: hypothetical protein NTZ89_03755 [Actinobacteria bacterium]|nr:hypothetical protein [Actinomycetota bacterium]